MVPQRVIVCSRWAPTAQTIPYMSFCLTCLRACRLLFVFIIIHIFLKRSAWHIFDKLKRKSRISSFLSDCPHSGFWSSIFGLWAMCKKSRCRSSCEFTIRGWRRTDLLYNWVLTKYTQLYRRSVRLQPRVVNSQDDRQRLFLHIAQSPNMEDQNPLCGQSLSYVFLYKVLFLWSILLLLVIGYIWRSFTLNVKITIFNNFFLKNLGRQSAYKEIVKNSLFIKDCNRIFRWKVPFSKILKNYLKQFSIRFEKEKTFVS